MPVQPEPSARPALDGRRNRTVQTRRRIAMALTELIREGRVAPTAEDVSERADVGLRTVFRHFDDMETLYREVHAELQSSMHTMLDMTYTSTHWHGRLMESIPVRGKLYESITPLFFSAKVNRHGAAVIKNNFKRCTDLERTILKRTLPNEVLADKPWLEALLMVLSPDAWVRLRREQGLSVKAAIAALELATHAIIARSPH